VSKRPLDFIERGDDVVALGVIGGTARESGRPFRSKWMVHWQFRA
jgi:hypothetical protein